MEIKSEVLIELASALGAGGLATKLFDMFMKRNEMRSYAMGAVDHAVETALASVTAQLKNTDERLQIAESHHARCEVALSDLNRRYYEQQGEINRLMQGPPATY